MAVTQYVGARYVPLFADPLEWDSERAYEPLTIVLHQGASYTSRQFVPVGVDIDNTDFWALTGNYNAQVEQYRLEVAQYVEEVETFADAIERSVKYDVNITTTQPEAPYDDADTFPVNTVIRIAQAGVAPYVRNLPVDDEYMIVLTIGASDIEGPIGCAQVALIQNDGNDLYWRSYGTEWNAWKQAANFTEVETAISELQTSVNSSISELQTSVNSSISELQTSVNSSISAIESEVTENLETSLTGKKHLVIIGDSFTSEVVRSYSWPAQMDDTYTVHNYASGGTGWLRTGSQATGESNHTFPQQLDDAIADGTYDHDLVEAVIAYGSYNDFVNGYTATQVREVICPFYQDAQEAFPGAKIIIVIGNNGFGTRSNADGYQYWLGDVLRGTGTAGFMVPVVNAVYWLWGFGQDTMFNDDGLHPNTAGARFIARYMTELLNGTYSPNTTWFYATLAGSSSGGQSSNLWAMFNPAGEFKLRGQYTFTISDEGDNYIELSSIDDGRFTQFYGQTCIPLNCFGNSRYLTGSYLNPSNGRLHIMATSASAGGSVYY